MSLNFPVELAGLLRHSPFCIVKESRLARKWILDRELRSFLRGRPSWKAPAQVILCVAEL